MTFSALHREAVSLVVVLVFIALIAALVVAFLGSVGVEMQTARSYESGVTVKQLVSTATNVATSQIVEGTRSQKVARAPGSTAAVADSERLAWASQPGMIRTWDGTGAGWKIFKLYSAPTMVVDFPGTYSTAANLAAEVPADWPAAPALYTDLNEPVVVPDPAGKIVRGSARLRASYPILDPLALAEIDGFSITRPVGFGGTLDGKAQPVVADSTDPGLAPKSGTTGNPAPMPVAWIYVLRNGALTAPTGSRDGGRTATWQGADPEFTPSRENPIVGRIAFWTDDETCKLNVNTSSEPTPWDTPRCVAIADLNYGRFQPAQREFQRFPGHPLTTALSPVLFSEKVRGSTRPLTPADKDLIYGLIPRVVAGGSRGGTVWVKDGTLAALTPDGDRLFANVDEFLFQPTRRAVTKEASLAALGLDTARLRRARFFLTANGRAPELNLYGQPRIALWPVPSDRTRRTAFDQLTAFCSTLGDASAGNARPFFFQRADAASPTADFDNLTRNRELYAYLQRLTASPVPGYGASFLGKWGQDRDQILTEIFDYIRATNLRDPLLVQQKVPRFADNGQVAPIRIGGAGSSSTRGFGRFHSISQFGFHFICSQDGPAGAASNPDGPNPPLTAGNRAIEAAFLLQPFSPSLGYFELLESISYRVTFKTPLRVDGQDLKFPQEPVVVSSPSGGFGNIWHGRSWGGAQGVRGPIMRFGAGGYPLRGPDPRSKTPLRRAVVSAANGRKTMSFSGGEVEVTVHSGGTPSAANRVQTFTVVFPATEIPIPDLVGTGTGAFRGASASGAADWWTFGGWSRTRPSNASGLGRYSFAGECPHAPGPEYTVATRRWGTDNGNRAPGFKRGGVFRAEDVVRTMVPVHGDLRLIAALNEVPAQRFVKGPGYDDATARVSHLFVEPQGPHMLYGFANEPGPSPAPGIPAAPADGQLVPDVRYHYARLAEILPGAGKAFNRWNDYDQGFAHMTDGPYINKPDEGNIADQNSRYPYFSWDFAVPSEKLFSPSRLVPSAGMLGSLPTGVKRNQPWETLLFRPEVRTDATGKPHPGRTSPPDHLIMDLFWMPMTEPYAISEPFSTAGKINLNYEIAPFSYIRRATALHGVFKGEEPLVLPHNLSLGNVPLSRIYKLWDHETNDWPYYADSTGKTQDPALGAAWRRLFNGEAPFDKLRRPIDVEKTLAQAEERFVARGEIFRSATEICELHLVRNGEELADYTSGRIWRDAQITGENVRERPYTNLYSKLTTRSNTFTIHIRAQVLRQSGGTAGRDWSAWREDRDQIGAEQRSAVTIERYIDPADRVLSTAGKDSDFAQNPSLTADQFFRTRVISTKKFVP